MTRVEALEIALKAIRKMKEEDKTEYEMDEATEVLLKLKKSLEHK